MRRMIQQAFVLSEEGMFVLSPSETWHIIRHLYSSSMESCIESSRRPTKQNLCPSTSHHIPSQHSTAQNNLTHRLKLGLQLHNGVREPTVFRQQSVVISLERGYLQLEPTEVCFLLFNLVPLPIFEPEKNKWKTGARKHLHIAQ